MYSIFFCFKQKTAYEMRISDWSSDVCSSDLENRVVVGVVHAQSHVGLELAIQTVAQLTTGHELAFASRQRGCVHHEVHGQRRLVDAKHGQSFRIGRLNDRAAYADFLDAVNQNDVAEIGGAACRERVGQSV